MTAWVKFAIVALAMALAAGGVVALRGHWVSQGEQRIRKEWVAQDEHNARIAAENAAELQRLARRAETLKQEEAERIARDQETRLARLAKHAGVVDARNRSLLNTIAALNARDRELSRARADASAGPVADGAAATARELLGQCSSRYAAVAAEAGRLASQVIGLQQYARMCHGQVLPEATGG